VKPLARLGPEGYTDEVSQRVYASLMEQADKVVRGGYTAIADAVFAQPADRDAVQHVARAAGVPFVGLWLEAPLPTLILRVEGREADVSDAGIDVIWRQLAYRLDSLPWHRLDASGTRQQVCDAVAAIVGQRGHNERSNHAGVCAGHEGFSPVPAPSGPSAVGLGAIRPSGTPDRRSDSCTTR